MKLYSSKVPVIAMDIVRLLTAEKDIEVGSTKEVEADIEAVLREYLRMERDLTEKAKDRVEQLGGGREDISRVKKNLAEQRNIGLGGDAISYILNQILTMLMRSPSVDEVFSDDDVIRRKCKKILERHMAAEEDLEKEVRDRMKNFSEGTSTWDVEYARVTEQVKRRRGIS